MTKQEIFVSDGPFRLVETPAHKYGVDAPGIFAANTMANVHNLFLRMLNSIYLQCEHVHNPKDVMDFLFYCNCWSRTMHHHHHSEEEELFPKIEETIGQPGMMESNVNQHDAFQRELKDLAEYTERCQEEGGQGFDGKRMKALIDSFGKSLELHMHEEIDSLLEVRKHDPDGEKTKEFFLTFEKKVQATLDTYRDFPWVVANVDHTYEGGIQRWPPFPWFVPYLVEYWYSRKYQGAWRFCSSDFHGRPRPLQFVS